MRVFFFPTVLFKLVVAKAPALSSAGPLAFPLSVVFFWVRGRQGRPSTSAPGLKKKLRSGSFLWVLPLASALLLPLSVRDGHLVGLVGLVGKRRRGEKKRPTKKETRVPRKWTPKVI